MAMSPLKAVKLDQLQTVQRKFSVPVKEAKSRLVKKTCYRKQMYISSLLFFLSFHTRRQHKKMFNILVEDVQQPG